MVLEGEMRRRVGEICNAEGLTPGLVKALAYLADAQPVPMSGMAAGLGCDSSYITGLVDDLERTGLAERRPHPSDRRVKTVVTTVKGRKVWERVNERLDEPPRAFATLSASEALRLCQLLRKLRDADTDLDSDLDPSGA
jgi:DNA-binding MarR family transcriptional regulator